MKSIIRQIRRFFTTMGLVEQSQVVASTAVVVAMVTIVSAHFMTGQSMEWLDFISVITVGVIGYVSVFFSLKYGRILEEQRRELIELNAITEAVNHSVELNYVLQSALVRAMELMHADCGWIYLSDNNTLLLKHHFGTSAKFFPVDIALTNERLFWIREPGILYTNDQKIGDTISAECRNEQIKILASIPLFRHGNFSGVLIIGSKEDRKFKVKKIALIQAFGNQISSALNNASLFEQVKNSERLYADLYEHSPDMYHSVDRNGVIVSCNVTECRYLGIPKENIIGRPLLSLYPSSQHDHVRSNLKKIFEEGKELKGIEEQILQHDGSLIDVSLNTSLVYDGDGKPIIARMVLRDITERKKMEEKILQAQKIDSIGNLAGGIAHNFNNILTAILGSASIMRRKVKENERLLKYLNIIMTYSHQGAAITRQLLTFARKSNPHIRLIDMNTAIDQTIRLFEATTSRSIEIRTHLSPDPVIIEGDEGQLQQALLNLCINASDAMPTGGVLAINCQSIVLDARQANLYTEGKAGDYVLITAADSGTGIPPKLINRIFEPFFTTKDQGKGTGLGLSVVHGVIRSHEGYINVASEVNNGTVFTIYLPRITTSELVKSSQRDISEPVGGNERILLIEDEVSVGEVGADILKDLGYSVEIVHNGDEAIQKLRTTEERFNLVILDMNMPRMGGRTTFEQIKKFFPTLKVIVCSGYSATMIDDGQFTQEIDGFIQKPYELDDIAQKIRQILDTPTPAPYHYN